MQAALSAMLPVEDENGVDCTLIRWMLSLSPTERIATLQDHIDFAVAAWESRQTRTSHARADEDR